MQGGKLLWTLLDPTRYQARQQESISDSGYETTKGCKESKELPWIYLTRYSGRLATLSSPLRDLTKQDTVYSWGPEHEHEVKKEVSSLGVLRYFDPEAETTV